MLGSILFENLLLVNITNVLLALLLGFLSYQFSRKFAIIRKLPPGPFPLPIIGNFMSLSNRTAKELFDDLRKKYGDVFTFWFGNVPIVIVTSPEIIKEALVDKKGDFNGRYNKPLFVRAILNSTNDLSVIDFSREWEIKRKLQIGAFRKFLLSKQLPIVVNKVFDDVIQDSMKENVPLYVLPFLSDLMYRIVAKSAYGSQCEEKSELFLKYRKAHYDTFDLIINGYLGDYIPFLRPFLYRKETIVYQAVETLSKFAHDSFIERKKYYKKGVIENILDAIMATKDDVTGELSDKDLSEPIFDIFIAGVDTIGLVLAWTILYITNDLKLQEKLHFEINDCIGEREPDLDDKRKCPYTWALISEVLRMKSIFPVAIPHKSMCDSHLGGLNIPNDTPVLFLFDNLNYSENVWKEPEIFRPERFLDGLKNASRENEIKLGAFGMGRRSCPGMNLARGYLFLILIKLVQKYKMTLPAGQGTANFVPLNHPSICHPQDFQIIFESRLKWK